MKNFAIALFASTLFLVPINGHSSQTAPPALFIDKGACPFECCSYGEWETVKTSTAYARPDDGAKQVGRFLAGEKVTALTGEVHTIAGHFIVKKEHKSYKPGDVLWVYTYLGEGHFKVWHQGKMYIESLIFSPYGGGPGKRCEASKSCWGELQSEHKSTWWVKIKSEEGWIGWTHEAENFKGADKCG